MHDRANAFKLHRLPVPRPGQVLGLVGTNGIGVSTSGTAPHCVTLFFAGKSTALKILSGKTIPNLGRFHDAPGWEEILLVCTADIACHHHTHAVSSTSGGLSCNHTSTIYWRTS